MGQFDFVLSPVSADDPCGPDLEGDSDFDGVLTSLEGRFPQSYLKFSNPPKMTSSSEMTELFTGFNLAAEMAPLLTLLKRSRDIRLLIPLAKLSILGGDFSRFCELVRVMAALIDRHWEDVHPRALDGSFVIRESHLSLLVDTATVTMPLQEKPFIILRRIGPVSYRTCLLSSKAVTPREKDTVIDESDLRSALVKSDDFADIKVLNAGLAAAASALRQIRTKFVDIVGGQEAPDFSKIDQIITGFTGFLQTIIAEREPVAAPVEDTEPLPGDTPSNASPAAGTPVPASAIRNSTDVVATLNGIETYFRRQEPSNPAMLLVRQAQQLVGKSFIEAMRTLNPDIARNAAIRIGGAMPLIIDADQMTELANRETGAAEDSPETPLITVASRGEASAIMELIEKFYQRTEPSSPIPLLLNRARSYAGKDFATLLKEIGPSDD